MQGTDAEVFLIENGNRTEIETQEDGSYTIFTMNVPGSVAVKQVEKQGFPVIWIVIAAAVLIAAAVVIIILIRKRKMKPEVNKNEM